MTNLSAEAEMIKALKSIRRIAMEHPCFDMEYFRLRDLDGLSDTGGDICDWTLIAIESDDALQLVGKGVKMSTTRDPEGSGLARL